MQNIDIRELSVMNEVAKLMKPLSKNEARRVIAWLAEYFDPAEADVVMGDADYEGAPLTITIAEAAPAQQDDIDGDFAQDDAPADGFEDAPEVEEPDTFETFYANIAPKTVIQKALTAAYWLETEDEMYSWRSHDITKILGSIGVKVNALSAALAIAEKKEEPLVELMSKSGDSMQARKTFRLAEAGRAWVAERDE